ncbi:MAG: nickel pincer cofactor biosynthesis protein LarC [Pyrinomonadaceae bacterium]
MRTLYFDCFAGASGNMILGALAALGIDRDRLVSDLKKLDIVEFELVFTDVDRSGILATHLDVKVPHEHVHRHLHHIEAIIGNSTLAESVRSRAIAIFTRLAEAEAKIHGIDLNKVHFHEVGAMDAIVDVVGACIAFDMLGIERFVCSKIHVGSGFAEMTHGKFPVPPPAVAELLTGIPIYSTEIEGELITPTGAAIISTLCDSYGTIPEMMVEQSAYGAGTRQYEKFPNVLRLILGRSEGSEKPLTNLEQLTLIETNIDDVSPQILGFVMERSFELGALDCWFTPIQMKKNRPATMISMLCQADKKDVLTQLLYTETTTIGVRFKIVERECLDREIVTVSTEFGEIDVKIAKLDGKIVNSMPEYEHVRLSAIKNSVPFKMVREAALAKLTENELAHTANA